MAECGVRVKLEAPEAPPPHPLSVENVKEVQVVCASGSSSAGVVGVKEKERRVVEWVRLQALLSSQELVDPTALQDEHNKYNKRKYFDSDDEFESSEEEIVEEPQKKKGRQEPTVYMDCEWVGCRFNTMDYSTFQEHVKSHLPDVIVKSYNNGSSVYVCLWDLCDYETPNDKMIKTHINYHTYHTYIKALGKDVLVNYAECYKDSSQRNRVPLLPEEFSCLWKNCTLKFLVIQDFFDHVKCHALGERKERGETMSCTWMGCPVKNTNPYSFLRHVLTHTLYRPIACPNCGTTYNDKSSMVVHCERQIKKLDYKCELCPRLFATPTLLQAHFRDHRRDFKCTDCGTTFSRKSSLVSHIRQVHLNIRSLQCNFCSYRCTNKSDMRDHLDRHEKKGRKWIGAMEGRLYVCHYCERNYSRATGLTTHLIKSHEYKPMGRSNRYKYVMTDEGVYRLDDSTEQQPADKRCTTEVSLKDIIKPEEEAAVEENKYKLVKSVKSEPKYALVKSSDEETKIKNLLIKQEIEEDEKPFTRASARTPKKKCIKCRKCKKYIVKESNGNVALHKCEQDVEDTGQTSYVSCKLEAKTHEPGGLIEISIEEMDLQGNIVKIEVVESEEMVVS